MADAGLCFIEGDKTGGYISLACAIPFAGVPTGVARGAKRVEQLSDYVKTIFKNSDNLAKSADEVAEVANDARQLLKNDIPQELAPICLGGDDVAKLVNKGEDVFDEVSDVAKHYDEDIYTTAKQIEGGSNPIGATYEGTIYRSVDSRYDPLEMSQYTINSNHRYTESGVPGLYFSSGEKIVKAELGNYDVFDFFNRTMYSYDVRLTNMLDVSNPSVRSHLGISLDSIIGES